MGSKLKLFLLFEINPTFRKQSCPTLFTSNILPKLIQVHFLSFLTLISL